MVVLVLVLVLVVLVLALTLKLAALANGGILLPWVALYSERRNLAASAPYSERTFTMYSTESCCLGWLRSRGAP